MNPLTEPSFIPVWAGWGPIRFWIAPEMRRFETEVRLALSTFERERTANGQALRLCFQEISAPQQGRCIDFRLEPLVGLLGLGMYPPPLNHEPGAGDVTLNSLVDWNRPGCRNLVLPVLIHELAAHSLGLGHYYDPVSVRFPMVSAEKVNLAAVDKEAFFAMYGV